MSTSDGGIVVVNLCAGFILGLAVLTISTAFTQTTQLKRPWRSVYIYMIWGEMTANFGIGILASLNINGVIQYRYVVLRLFHTVLHF